MPKNRSPSSIIGESLAQSAYADVFELLHTGIAVLSAKGRFLYCNQAFLSMFHLPRDIKDKHVSDFFLTAEQGVMATIRTRQPTYCSSLTNTDAQGISFRYPLLDTEGKLYGVIIESIPPNIDPERMRTFMDTIRDLEKKSNYLEQKVRQKTGRLYTFDSLIGHSPALMGLKKKGLAFARGGDPILVLGESGTGKEMVAQALHSASPRADKPFVTVNCAALPADLIEAELFGYESGAFTGAKSGGMKGKFELAHKGTIFLDEIGELPLPVQSKLLRVLETGEIQKLAHRGELHSDFRLLAATNKDLKRCVDHGTFREDLYHRLDILELIIPPLRERVGDIPLLAPRFIELHAGIKRAREIQISSEVYHVFGLYPWHGNIRELKNVITYALFQLEEDENILSTHHLPVRFFRELASGQPEIRAKEAGAARLNLSEAGAEAERKALVAALSGTKYNKTLAARVLGISRNKLYKKLREFNML